MYCNEEIIAINQDSLFSTARPYMMLESGDRMLHIFEKKLSCGAVAYAVFNLGKTEETAKIYLDSESEIRDLWAKKNLKSAKTVSLVMPPHTVRIIKTKLL